AAVGGRRLQLIHLHAVQANAAVGRGQPRFGDPQVPATHRTIRRLALQAVAQPLGQDDSYRCFHVPSVGGHQPEAAVRHFPAGRLRRQLLRQVRVLDADVVGDFHAVAGPVAGVHPDEAVPGNHRDFGLGQAGRELTLIHLVHGMLGPQAERPEPAADGLGQLVQDPRQAPLHVDDNVLQTPDDVLAGALAADPRLLDALAGGLELRLHLLAGLLHPLHYFGHPFGQGLLLLRFRGARERLQELGRLLGGDLPLLQHGKDQQAFLFHRGHPLSILMASAAVISPRSKAAKISARRSLADVLSRSTLWPMASSTPSSRLRTVGYEMPSTRSTSLMLPRASRNTSTNSCCSGVSRSNLDCTKRPSTAVPQLTHSRRRTSRVSLHTGQRPMVLWAIRITFLGLLCVFQTGTLNLSISWLNLTGKIQGCQRIPFTFSQDRNHMSRKGPPWQRRRRCRDRAPAETEPTHAGTLQDGRCRTDVAGR